MVPAQTCYLASQLNIPNSGASTPEQPGMRITGASWQGGGNGGTAPTSGSVLKLASTPSTCGEICTLGFGNLEIDHVAIYSTAGSGSESDVLWTTNTKITVHDMSFYGTLGQTMVVLGGSSASIGSAYSDAFQGYGTEIRDTYSNNIGRLVLGQTYADAVQIVDNSIAGGAGGYAAIDFAGTAAGFASGNLIHGNYIEDGGYTYGISIATVGTSTSNTITDNLFFDGSAASTLAHYYFGSNGVFNLVVSRTRTTARSQHSPVLAAPRTL